MTRASRTLLVAGAGVYLGMWIQNYRFLMAAKQVVAAAEDEKIKNYSEQGIAEISEWLDQ